MDNRNINSKILALLFSLFPTYGNVFPYSNDLYVWTLVVVLYCHWSKVNEVYQSFMQNIGASLGPTVQFYRDLFVHIPDAEQRIPAIGAAWSPSRCIVCITYIA